MHNKHIFALYMLCLLALIGCAPNPVTPEGQKRSSTVSERGADSHQWLTSTGDTRRQMERRPQSRQIRQSLLVFSRS